MMLRNGLALALALLCVPALAAPVLRAEVAVSGPLVLAGDLFAEAGPAAGVPVFRAPAPGTTGLVPLAAVQSAARAAGIGAFDAAGLTEIRVVRPAAVIDDAAIAEALRAEVASRGLAGGASIVTPVLDRTGLSLRAEAVAAPLAVEAFQFTPQSGRFTARLRLAGLDAPLDVSGRIELMVEAPHLISALAGGAVLSAADIEMRPVPARLADAVPDAQALVGKALRRPGRSGLMLRAADVAEPLVVHRNQPVTVYLRRGALTLTIKGQAVTAAAAGQPVQVLNPATRRVLQGIARPDGSVELAANPQLALAGL